MKFVRPLEISQGWKKDQACVWMKREFFIVPDRLEAWKNWRDPADADRNKTNATKEDATNATNSTDDPKLRELEERNAK